MGRGVRLLVLAFMASVGSIFSASAAEEPADMIRLLEDGATPVPATLDDAAWLVGSWQGRMYDMVVEHVILPEKLDHLPSFVRAVGEGADEIAFYEISVFAEVDGTIVNRVKHFTGELAGWEGREEYIERRLVEFDDGVLYFDGLTFERTGPDDFTVYFLEQGGPNEGNVLVIGFTRTDAQD